MLWLIGGWGNRPDPLSACAERLYRSLQLMPDQTDVYGAWGIWRPNDADDPTQGASLVSVETGDVGALEPAIAEVTIRGNNGKPRRAPGVRSEFARELIGERPPASPTRFAYNVRAGYTEMSRPFNHVALELESGADEHVVTAYTSALVQAWQPEHLGAVTQEAKRAQGQRPPEVSIGRLTYVRAGTPLDVEVLGEDIEVAEADGGSYVRIPGTLNEPSLTHIHRVRRALGYSDATTA